MSLSVSLVIVPRLSKSGYVTFLPLPHFKQSLGVFLLIEIMWCEVYELLVGMYCFVYMYIDYFGYMLCKLKKKSLSDCETEDVLYTM